MQALSIPKFADNEIKEAFDHHYHAPLVVAPGKQVTLKLAIPKKELNTPLKIYTILGEYALEDDNNHIRVISNRFPDNIVTIPPLNGWNTIGITINTYDALHAQFNPT